MGASFVKHFSRVSEYEEETMEVSPPRRFNGLVNAQILEGLRESICSRRWPGVVAYGEELVSRRISCRYYEEAATVADVELLRHLGRAYAEIYCHDKAVMVFSSLQEICRREDLTCQLWWVLTGLGKTLMCTGAYEEAREAYAEALDIALRQNSCVRRVTALSNLTDCLQKLCQAELLTPHLADLRLDLEAIHGSHSIAILGYLSMSVISLAAGRQDEAAIHLKQARDCVPTLPRAVEAERRMSAYLIMGFLHCVLKQPNEAMLQCRLAQEYASAVPGAHRQLGLAAALRTKASIHIEKEEFAEAEKCYVEALSCYRSLELQRDHPEVVTVTARLARVLIRNGKHHLAVEHLNALLSHYTNSKNVRKRLITLLRLSVAYAGWNRHDAALRIRERAVALASDNSIIIPDKYLV